MLNPSTNLKFLMLFRVEELNKGRLKRSLMTSRSMAAKMKTIDGLGKTLGDSEAIKGLEISKMETQGVLK